MDEWLDHWFYLTFSGNDLLGCLAITTEIEKTSWIRLFAHSRGVRQESIWRILFDTYLNQKGEANSQLYALGTSDWFSDLLLSSSFHTHQKIIFFQNDLQNQFRVKDQGKILVTYIELSQLQEIVLLDNISFPPSWQLPYQSLKNALAKSSYATVAILNGKIVGYQITTESHLSAHLARLAVDPQYRQQGISKTLLFHLFNYCKRRGINKITVNTQDDNSISQRLYLSSGFKPIEENYPVFIKE